MLSIIFFSVLVLPFIVVIVLGYLDLPLGQVLLNMEMNYFLKFLVGFAIFFVFYYVIRTLINYCNGGLKRGPFFSISFGALGLIAVILITLRETNVLDSFTFDSWTIAVMFYFLITEALALLFAFVRTLTDGKYYCAACGRFGPHIFDEEDVEHDYGSYDKDLIDLHSYQKYVDTTVTTKKEWEELDGRIVEGSMKESKSYRDNYKTEYYTTDRKVTRKYKTTKCILVCKNCGSSSRYFSIDPF